MKCHISCKDEALLGWVGMGGGKTRAFKVEVDDDEDSKSDNLFITFMGVGLGTPVCPVKHWPKLKETIDKLIIKAEHLRKEAR